MAPRRKTRLRKGGAAEKENLVLTVREKVVIQEVTSAVTYAEVSQVESAQLEMDSVASDDDDDPEQMTAALAAYGSLKNKRARYDEIVVHTTPDDHGCCLYTRHVTDDEAPDAMACGIFDTSNCAIS